MPREDAMWKTKMMMMMIVLKFQGKHNLNT